MAEIHLNRVLPRLTGLLSALLCAAVLCVPMAGCETDPRPRGSRRSRSRARPTHSNSRRTTRNGPRASASRTELPDNGGMLFVFKRAERRQFLMRDCYMDIDIIFLDANGTITAFHHMPMEPPGPRTRARWAIGTPGNRRTGGTRAGSSGIRAGGRASS